MTSPIRALIEAGSKIWLDSVDPDEVQKQLPWGISGATSNPVIVQGLIETGHFDEELRRLLESDMEDEAIAWEMTDILVTRAQETFKPFWEKTNGDDGYVSFELDPLLEDPGLGMSDEERAKKYVELGKKWSAGHENRMIKVPNTKAGCAALEELTAEGITLNVTLTFTPQQYVNARDAIWRGAQKRGSLDKFKSVYSIFVSRVDVYTAEHVPELSAEAQGQVGIVNAKQIWKMNQEFWADKNCPLQQEIIFASTGTKLASDPKWKYVAAFAGSDIETNPPATNEAVHESGQTFTKQVDQFPPAAVLQEIEQKVDKQKMEDVLMREGIEKVVKPQRKLLELIAKKRAEKVESV